MSSKFQVIIENAGAKSISGRIENKDNFMPNTIASNVKEVNKNLKDLIVDYQKHGGNKDPFWKKVKASEIEFEYVYDLQAFFMEHDYLNITGIANIAGLNPGLVRQYASGVKHPSKEQAEKIARTVRGLAEQLKKVELV